MKTAKEVRESDLRDLTIESIWEDMVWEAPPAALSLFEQDKSEMEGLIALNEADGAAAAGIRIGARWMAMLDKLKRSRGGRRRDPIWDFVIQVYLENKGEKKLSIYSEARKRLKAKTGKTSKLEDEDLDKHFSRVKRMSFGG